MICYISFGIVIMEKHMMAVLRIWKYCNDNENYSFLINGYFLPILYWFSGLIDVLSCDD